MMKPSTRELHTIGKDTPTCSKLLRSSLTIRPLPQKHPSRSLVSQAHQKIFGLKTVFSYENIFDSKKIEVLFRPLRAA